LSYRKNLRLKNTMFFIIFFQLSALFCYLRLFLHRFHTSRPNTRAHSEFDRAYSRIVIHHLSFLHCYDFTFWFKHHDLPAMALPSNALHFISAKPTTYQVYLFITKQNNKNAEHHLYSREVYIMIINFEICLWKKFSGQKLGCFTCIHSPLLSPLF
jgi:hypothetical protein